MGTGRGTPSLGEDVPLASAQASERVRQTLYSVLQLCNVVSVATTSSVQPVMSALNNPYDSCF